MIEWTKSANFCEWPDLEEDFPFDQIMWDGSVMPTVLRIEKVIAHNPIMTGWNSNFPNLVWALANLHFISWQTNDSLDDEYFRFLGRNSTDDVSAMEILSMHRKWSAQHIIAVIVQCWIHRWTDTLRFLDNMSVKAVKESVEHKPSINELKMRSDRGHSVQNEAAESVHVR